MNNEEYVRLSLELHLFFDRIMKEHSLFLEMAFSEKDKNLKKIASEFQNFFSNTLKEVVKIANGNVSSDLLTSGEIITNNTLKAEGKTNNLLGSDIDTNITIMETNLKSGNVKVSEELISSINKRTLPYIKNLIKFKNDILNNVLSCNLYTLNYPLLITHIMNEAKMYYNLLSRIEERKPFTRNYIYEQEVFWNNIMKEHAEFIRGLLDPAEKDLIDIADNFVKEYEMILNGNNYVESDSLKETIKFRNFKIAGEEGILNCKIKSIIIPLLADHVLREANHFIRILNSKKD